MRSREKKEWEWKWEDTCVFIESDPAKEVVRLSIVEEDGASVSMSYNKLCHLIGTLHLARENLPMPRHK